MFGYGLCAWRDSNLALNPWSAPWMLRIGDRLPSIRSNPNRPTVMHFLGSIMLSAGHSTNDSAVMGLIAAAEALENSKICSQCSYLTLELLRPPRSSSAPGTPLRNQFVAALLGATGFQSRWIRLALQHHLGGGWCCLHQGWWAFSRCSFPYLRGGPNSHWGSTPGECCVRRVTAQPCGSRLARGETRQRAK